LYRLASAKAGTQGTTLCLDSNGGEYDTLVIMQQCTTSNNNQLWQLVDAGGGNTYLQAYSGR
jgi:hypothetical protein